MTINLLRDLIEITGVSGNESTARKFIIKEIKKSVKDVKIDKFGNVVAHKKGKGKKVMLAAHMDEIGMMVKSIHLKGNVHCSPIGGIDAVSMVGHRVKIQGKKGFINGVVTLPGLSEGVEPDELPTMEDVIVDTGLTKPQLNSLGVRIGSFIELERESFFLGSKEFLAGKALDDRVGCYILLELANKLKNTDVDVYYVFTVQEEVGLYGSRTAIHSIDPDWALAIDVSPSNDIRVKQDETTRRLGDGPTITIKDAEMLGDKIIDDHLVETAESKKIPYQLDVSEAGTTDALSISLSKGGIPTTAVGVPVRNIHTNFGVVNTKDIKNCVKLLYELIKKHPKMTIK